MSHPPELIKAIQSKLELDYSPGVYTYVIERAIPGTRFMPDILVLNPDGGLQCAVEIGYTRPEKLSAYRKDLRIPDVRWYDKQGNLHADVEEKVVRVNVQMSLQTPERISVYTVWDQVACDCLWGSLCELDCGGESECEECLNGPFEDVLTYILTDWVVAFYLNFCDKCGRAFWAHPYETWGLDYDLDESSPQAFARQHGGVQRCDWNHAQSFVKREFGLELSYEDGHIISPDDRMSLATDIRIIQENAVLLR